MFPLIYWILTMSGAMLMCEALKHSQSHSLQWSYIRMLDYINSRLVLNAQGGAFLVQYHMHKYHNNHY